MPLSVGELVGYLRLDSASFDRGILSAQRELDLTASSAERMGSAVGTSETALIGAGRAASTAATGSAKLRANQLSLTAAQERYNALLANGNASTARLASAEATLIRANERVSASMPNLAPMAAGAESAATGMARARTAAAGMLETMGKLGLMLGAFEVARKGIEAIKGGVEFQKQMTMIQTNANASATEVTKMSKALLGLSGQVATGPLELATSLYHVEQNGLRGAKALDVVKTAAMGAQIGNADLESTTNSMTAAVASGIPGVKNLDQAMGALIATVGTGDMKMKDLNEALGSGLLAVVKGYGLSLKDVGAALAVFGDNNIRGADAATMLRTAVQAFAKPAKGGAKALDDIGVSANQLRDDMQKGGLNAAVLDLTKHMEAAGYTGAKAGSLLLDAFGKKAGPGVSVLLGQVDRLETKYKELTDASDNFAQKWATHTHTAAYAFQLLGTEIKTAGIEAFQKIQPVVSDVAVWLGTKLPRAIKEVQDTLQPLEREIGSVLVPAFKAGAVILGGTIKILGDFGHALQQHKTIVTVVGTSVLGMWAAWKGYAIVSTAIKAVKGALDTLALKAMYARDAVAGVASGTTAIAGSSLALGVLGIAIGAAAYAWQKHSAAVAKNKQEIKDFTAAIEADNGAIGDHTRAIIEDQLQQDGLVDAARKAGINLKTLTDAFMGNSDALSTVNGQLGVITQGVTDYAHQAGYAGGASANLTAAQADAYQGAVKLGGALGDTTGKLADAVQAAKDKAAMDGKSTDAIGKQTTALAAQADQISYVVDASGSIVKTQQKAGAAVDDTTVAIVKQKTAAENLKDALDILNGVSVSVETSTNAFLDSLSGMTDEFSKASAATDADKKKQAELAARIAAIDADTAKRKGKISATEAQHRRELVAQMNALTSSTGTYSTSLDQSTEAGRKNREMLVQQIQAASDNAQAVADNVSKAKGMDEGLKAGAEQMRSNEQAIRDNATALGFNKSQIDAMILSLGKIPTTPIVPKVNPAPAKSALQDVATHLENLHNKFLNNELRLDNRAALAALAEVTAKKQAVLGLLGPSADVREAARGAHAAGGLLDPGWNLVGEKGPELVNSRTGRVLTAGQTASAMGGSTGRSVTVYQTINNPVPEPASTSGVAGMRRAAYALGGV